MNRLESKGCIVTKPTNSPYRVSLIRVCLIQGRPRRHSCMPPNPKTYLQVDIEMDLEGMAGNGADLVVEVELDFEAGESRRSAGLPYDLDGQGSTPPLSY